MLMASPIGAFGHALATISCFGFASTLGGRRGFGLVCSGSSFCVGAFRGNAKTCVLRRLLGNTFGRFTYQTGFVTCIQSLLQGDFSLGIF